MKIIAHRGLTDGPNAYTENNPSQIKKAIEMGFDCEVDLRCGNSRIYFGHSAAQYEVDIHLIRMIKHKCWFHCKNFEAASFANMNGLHNLIHDKDCGTYTSNGFLWTDVKKLALKVPHRSIYVSPEAKSDVFGFFGLCIDYPQRF